MLAAGMLGCPGALLRSAIVPLPPLLPCNKTGCNWGGLAGDFLRGWQPSLSPAPCVSCCAACEPPWSPAAAVPQEVSTSDARERMSKDFQEPACLCCLPRSSPGALTHPGSMETLPDSPVTAPLEPTGGPDECPNVLGRCRGHIAGSARRGGAGTSSSWCLLILLLVLLEDICHVPVCVAAFHPSAAEQEAVPRGCSSHALQIAKHQ